MKKNYTPSNVQLISPKVSLLTKEIVIDITIV